MLTLPTANGYPLSCKWVPCLLQMGTLSPANDYPVCCKWVPCLLQMTTLSCKWVPSLLQMGTLSPANDYPLCCFSNAYPLCCKWVLFLQNFPSCFVAFYGQLVKLDYVTRHTLIFRKSQKKKKKDKMIGKVTETLQNDCLVLTKI